MHYCTQSPQICLKFLNSFLLIEKKTRICFGRWLTLEHDKVMQFIQDRDQNCKKVYC